MLSVGLDYVECRPLYDNFFIALSLLLSEIEFLFWERSHEPNCSNRTNKYLNSTKCSTSNRLEYSRKTVPFSKPILKLLKDHLKLWGFSQASESWCLIVKVPFKQKNFLEKINCETDRNVSRSFWNDFLHKSLNFKTLKKEAWEISYR